MSDLDKSSKKIPDISVTDSPKSKSKKKKGEKPEKSLNNDEQNSELRRKRSKSAIDLSAFTNMTVLSLDSDFRTLGYVRWN